jgi:hypothetical protein
MLEPDFGSAPDSRANRAMRVCVSLPGAAMRQDSRDDSSAED